MRSADAEARMVSAVANLEAAYLALSDAEGPMAAVAGRIRGALGEARDARDFLRAVRELERAP